MRRLYRGGCRQAFDIVLVGANADDLREDDKKKGRAGKVHLARLIRKTDYENEVGEEHSICY